MIIEKKMYCIVSKTFPLKFCSEGYDYSTLDESVMLKSFEDCKKEFKEYGISDNYQIVPVNVTYEI
jgi:hypothetical protein